MEEGAEARGRRDGGIRGFVVEERSRSAASARASGPLGESDRVKHSPRDRMGHHHKGLAAPDSLADVVINRRKSIAQPICQEQVSFLFWFLVPALRSLFSLPSPLTPPLSRSSPPHSASPLPLILSHHTVHLVHLSIILLLFVIQVVNQQLVSCVASFCAKLLVH